MARDWDAMRGSEAFTVLPPHPAPIVRALEVGADDPRVCRSARSAASLAGASGWDARLSYALGYDVRPDGGAGAVVASMALWCRPRGTSGGHTVYAAWLTRAKASCMGCGGQFMPTSAGLFRAHNETVGIGDRCAGSGQYANALRVDDLFAVTGEKFWHARLYGHAASLNFGEFRAVLKGEFHVDGR